jgi:hypothetical protein
VVKMTFAAKTTVLLSSRCQPPKLTMLMHRVHYPVDSRVLTDGRMGGIDENNFEILVGRVLVDPVRIEDSKASQLAPCSLLSNGSQTTLELQLGDTLVLGLTIYNTLGHRPLPASAAHTNTVHNKTLLGLVAEAAGLVWARGSSEAHNARELTKLPASNAQQKPKHIRLLFAP